MGLFELPLGAHSGFGLFGQRVGRRLRLRGHLSGIREGALRRRSRVAQGALPALHFAEHLAECSPELPDFVAAHPDGAELVVAAFRNAARHGGQFGDRFSRPIDRRGTRTESQ